MDSILARTTLEAGETIAYDFQTPPPVFENIKPDIRVAFILSPCFSILPFAAFVDSLRIAADEADYSRQVYCQWKVISSRDEHIPSSSGTRILPDQHLDDAGEMDYLVVVGGTLPGCLDISAAEKTFIRKTYEAGVQIVGLCTGSFILAEIGVLSGRSCAVHSFHLSDFRALFPNVASSSSQAYVDDSGVLTCPGVVSAFDLAIHMIAKHCGKARAVKSLNLLQLKKSASSPSIEHRPFGHLAVCGNRKVENAVQIMERHLAKPYAVSLLAQKVGSSERELWRLFKRYGNTSPSAVWREIRIAHAQWLMLNSDRTMTQIAYECGFADSAHFSRWFKVLYGEAPQSYRRRRLRING